MDKRLLAIISLAFSFAVTAMGAGSPYIPWFKGVGTNTFLTNAVIQTPTFLLNTNLGSVAPAVFLAGTNVYANPQGKHISLVTGSAIATSTDGAFGIFQRFKETGVNLEFPNNGPEQVAIVEVIDANTAIVGEGLGAALLHANVTINNSTDWIMRSDVFATSDNTVGAQNYGLRVDGNGGVWQWNGAFQGAYYFFGGQGLPVFSIGGISASAVGLQGQETYGFSINTFRTNAADYPSSKAAQVYVSPLALAETLVLSGGAATGNGNEIAVQGPIINRHGSTVPFVPIPIFTNGVASSVSNALAIITISTGFTATNGGFNWTNPFTKNIFVFINNAGVTASSFKINGSAQATYSSANGNWTIPMQPGEWFSYLFSVGTPVVTAKPF